MTSIDDHALLAWIAGQIEAGRFAFTSHALTSHPFTEGFTPRQALAAMAEGRVIERRDEDRRCLVAGVCADLAPRAEFVGSFVHLVVSWDAPVGVVIVTMYRPRVARWTAGTERRVVGEEGL